MKEFSEDEKTIAMNIDKKYKWIARDDNGCLCIYKEKPKKSGNIWNTTYGKLFDECETLAAFMHMFKSIKWEDDEPTRIRDIYDPQILDDVERKYLGYVLKPFHEEVGYVEKRESHILGEETNSKEYLYVKLYDGGFIFPDFDCGKMYSGMEPNRRYNLDDLGITYGD